MQYFFQSSLAGRLDVFLSEGRVCRRGRRDLQVTTEEKTNWKWIWLFEYTLFYLFDRIAKEINARGEYFPIFGICLGFELLTYIAANRVEHRTICSSSNQPLPLQFTHGKYYFHMSETSLFSVIYSPEFFLFLLLLYLCLFKISVNSKIFFFRLSREQPV